MTGEREHQPRISAQTAARLRVALGDPDVVTRYRAKIATVAPYECWFWTGAVAAKGHGRFWIGNDHSPAPTATADPAVPGARTARDAAAQLAIEVPPQPAAAVPAPAGPRNFTVIAHRFGYGLLHGFDALMDVEVVAHGCDNPLCQRPTHWRESTHAANKAEWAARRHSPGGPLRDLRGARRRAVALRDAIRAGRPLPAVLAAGIPTLDRDQLPLWAESG